MTYMNRSGLAVSQFLNFFNVSHRDMLVVHDDIDLGFGIIKIKEKGGDGGHKGIRSIVGAVGKDDFTRLRIGIGRPEFRGNVSDHVLKPFSGNLQSSIEQIVDVAQDAVLTILCKGTKEGMNRFNKKQVLNSSE